MKDIKVICIVFGGSTNGLGQIRAINQAGFRCINVVEKGLHSWTRKSNLCEGILAPHPYNERKQCLKYTIELIKHLPSKPFLFFASDDWMDMVGENEALFSSIAYIPQSPWSIVSKLYNKKYLYQIAAKHGIPYPKTIEYESLNDIKLDKLNLQEPFIVKPQTTTSQNLISQAGIQAFHRTQKFNDKGSLRKWMSNLLRDGIDFPVLIQEFIPGDATTLYTLTSYTDKNGVLLAGSVGHKLRQFPPTAGRITSGILEFNENLFEVGKHFLKSVGFHGLANTEFKYDIRDKKYKLMEINTRLGAWNYSTLYSGLNLIEIAVKDTLGIPYNGPEYNTAKDGYIWYNLATDLASSTYLNRKIDPEFQISIIEWYKSLKGKSFEASWSLKDPLPFIYNFLYLIRKFISRS